MLSAVAARKAAKLAAAGVLVAISPAVDAVAATVTEVASLSSVDEDQAPERDGSSESDDAFSPALLPSSPKKRKRQQEHETKSRKRRRPSPNELDDLTRPTFPTFETSGSAYSPGIPVDIDGEENVDIEEGEVMSEVDELPEPVPLPRPIVPHVAASTYVPSTTTFFPLSISENTLLGLSAAPAILLALHADEVISFAGAVRLLVCRGAISLLGVTLAARSATYPVFAPKSHALPVLTALPVSRSSLSTNLDLPHFVGEKCPKAEVIVVLQEMRTGVESLGRICPSLEGVFTGAEDPKWGITGFHPNTSDAPHLQPFGLPGSWDRAMDTFVPSENDPLEERFRTRVALVRGVKNSGKSTFARTLLNRLTMKYQRVAFLECDIGQSEFTPPGLVSLHIHSSPVFGPAFTHPCLPYRAHYIGSSSPRSDPAFYLAAIEALLQTFRLDVQFIPPSAGSPTAAEGKEADDRIVDVVPLVINTMGWTKGLGSRLLARIEELANPTNIFEFADVDLGHPLDTFQPSSATSGGNVAQVHALTPVPLFPRQAQYNAASLRALSIMSYLHNVPTLPHDLTPQWTSLPLCAMLPWEVNCMMAFDRLLLIGPGSEDVVPSEIGTVLNGALVAFVTVDEPVEPALEAPGVVTYEQGSPTPAPFGSTCLGLGIVRSFSVSTMTMQVLTPLPAAELAKCRVLVKGELELPIWGFLDHRQRDEGEEGDAKGLAGIEWSKVPYLDWSGARGVGGERRRVRRNLMRRSQM